MAYRIKVLLTKNDGDWRRQSTLSFKCNSSVTFGHFCQQCASKLYPEQTITNSTKIKLYDIQRGLIPIDDNPNTPLSELYEEDDEIYRNCQILVILPSIHIKGILHPSDKQKLALREEQELSSYFTSSSSSSTNAPNVSSHSIHAPSVEQRAFQNDSNSAVSQTTFNDQPPLIQSCNANSKLVGNTMDTVPISEVTTYGDGVNHTNGACNDDQKQVDSVGDTLQPEPYTIDAEHDEYHFKPNAEDNSSSRDNDSPLIQACHGGLHEAVKSLLKNPNIQINGKSKSDGATALFVACRQGSTECVRQLLTNDSIFINEPKTNGRTPLFIASFFGHAEIVEMLISHSNKMIKQPMSPGVIDINHCDSKGFTALFVAAQNGHTRIVCRLLQNNADVNQAESRGHTILWIASLRGHDDVVRVLISHPMIDIDYKDLSGITALWAASQNNNSEIVELLLHPRCLKFNIYWKNDIKYKSYLYDLETNASDTLLIDGYLRQSLDSSLDIVPVSSICFIYFHDTVLVEYEAHKHVRRDSLDESTSIWELDDSDISDSENETAQHSQGIKSQRQKPKRNKKNITTKAEQRRGANPNLSKHDGCTPLWIAASRGNTQCMEPLINYGADLNKPDRSQGSTPLFVACQNGKKQAVHLLLAANADVNRPRSGDGTSPLMMAAHNGYAEIVDILLKSGADPRQANTTGLNALGCAAMQGHVEIIKLIHQHLLNTMYSQEIIDFVNAGDGVNGWTPLHLACMGGHEEVIKYLINTVKVDIFKKDYENKTALEHAWQNGHQSIVTWLSQLEHQYSTL